MYGMRLDTADKRQEARNFYLKVCKAENVKEYPESKAVVGTYETAGKFYGMGFKGTQGKPDFHYSFRSQESREKYINEWLEGLKKTQVYKQERKDKRKAPTLSVLPFKVGDILYNSWGYDQTNVDFYEVIEVRTASTIIIRGIGQNTTETGFMCGDTTPRPGEYTSEILIKRVQWYDNKPYINFEFGCGGKWDGKPERCSWYA